MPLPPSAPVVSDTSEWNLASRALLSKYNHAIDAFQRTVKPLIDQVKLDASDPLFTGDTPAAFLFMLNDKLDSTALGLEKGRESLLESFKSSLPITILGALMTIGPAKSVLAPAGQPWHAARAPFVGDLHHHQEGRRRWIVLRAILRDGTVACALAGFDRGFRGPHQRHVRGQLGPLGGDEAAHEAWRVRRGSHDICVHFQLQGCKRRGDAALTYS